MATRKETETLEVELPTGETFTYEISPKQLKRWQDGELELGHLLLSASGHKLQKQLAETRAIVRENNAKKLDVVCALIEQLWEPKIAKAARAYLNPRVRDCHVTGDAEKSTALLALVALLTGQTNLNKKP